VEKFEVLALKMKDIGHFKYCTNGDYRG